MGAVPHTGTEMEANEGRMGDALAPGGDEGRGKLRKAARERVVERPLVHMPA